MTNQFDVLILGSGIAGLYAALQFPADTRVLLLSKGEPALSGSALAQGGVAAVLDHYDDSFELHFQDTVKAGGYKNKPEAVEQLIHEGPEDVRKIMALGVAFDSDEEGTPSRTLEGGHSRRRIVHRRDQTGKEIVDALLLQVRSRSNIQLWGSTPVYAIQAVRGGFRADILLPEGPGSFKRRSVFASFVLLATGGIGRVFRYTTNPDVSTGDGIRFAHELGAKIKNLHWIQFHPTALRGEGECFLISEAVRGEGAYLLNGNGERFLERYDERLELAPRDAVSRAMILESRRLNDDRFYLDITHRDKNYLYERFPAIRAACLERGLDIATDWIPVYPCQHYLMGGVDVDLEGRSTLPRLYAAGECAHTGLHGGNRLASNSLPETLVFGRHAARDILRCLESGFARPQAEATDWESGAPKGDTPLPENIVAELRDILQNACFVIPDEAAIAAGVGRVGEILALLQNGDYAPTKEYIEAKSIATIASIILQEYRDENL